MTTSTLNIMQLILSEDEIHSLNEANNILSKIVQIIMNDSEIERIYRFDNGVDNLVTNIIRNCKTLDDYY